MEVNETRMFRTNDRNGRETSFDPPARSQSPSHRAEEREFIQKVRANLHHVPRVARKRVERMIINGLSCSDVAKQLGVSQGTVRGRYCAAARILVEFGTELPALPEPKLKAKPTQKLSPKKKEAKILAQRAAPLQKMDNNPSRHGMLERFDDLLPRLEKLRDFIGRLDAILAG